MINLVKTLSILFLFSAMTLQAKSLNSRWERSGVACASGKPAKSDWVAWRYILDLSEAPFYTIVKTREGATFFETGEYTVSADNVICLKNDFYDQPLPVCYDVFLSGNNLKLGEQIMGSNRECEQGDYLIRHFE